MFDTFQVHLRPINSLLELHIWNNTKNVETQLKTLFRMVSSASVLELVQLLSLCMFAAAASVLVAVYKSN